MAIGDRGLGQTTEPGVGAGLGRRRSERASSAGLLVGWLDEASWARYAAAAMAIMDEAYEPARRAPRSLFDLLIERPDCVSLIALRGDELVGFCFGGPLELFPDVEGTRSDPEWERSSTLYSADVTVTPENRGQGVGLRLKLGQLAGARALGYGFVAGRNRLRWADVMWRLNRKCGAYPVHRLRGVYRDGLWPDACVYYHIDLAGPRAETWARLARGGR